MAKPNFTSDQSRTTTDSAGPEHRLLCTATLAHSGRDMMAGERAPKTLVQLERSRMRTKITTLEEAFIGHFMIPCVLRCRHEGEHGRR